MSLATNGAAPSKLAPVLRSRLRHSDRLCRLDAQRFVVVAQGTDLRTAEALAADLRRHVQRAELVTADVEIEVQEPDAKASAQDLLKHTNLKIVEICYRVGFKDLAHFNHTFKRFVGISPNQFRQYGSWEALPAESCLPAAKLKFVLPQAAGAVPGFSPDTGPWTTLLFC